MNVCVSHLMRSDISYATALSWLQNCEGGRPLLVISAHAIGSGMKGLIAVDPPDTPPHTHTHLSLFLLCPSFAAASSSYASSLLQVFSIRPYLKI